MKTSPQPSDPRLSSRALDNEGHRDRRRLSGALGRRLSRYQPSVYEAHPDGTMVLGVAVIDSAEMRALAQMRDAAVDGADDATVAGFARRFLEVAGLTASRGPFSSDLGGEITAWPDESAPKGGDAS